MATEIQKINAIRSQKFKYASRISYFYQAQHINDEFKNLGYNYRGKIYKKMTSPELWANPIQTSLFGRLEGMITYLLEQAKSIKKTFSIAHSQNTININ